MDRIDAYCERLGPEFWAEPVNALTNLAFLLAALVMGWRWRRDPLARALALMLAAIGVGSFLFHTLATRWAAAADTGPILLFILLYVCSAHRRIWGQGGLASAGFAALTIPWLAVLTPLFERLPGFSVSSFYWPVPALILLHALLLRRRAPATARRFAIGAGLLSASLLFRSLDGALCGVVPVGTHFLWHLLNALMLGWMIEALGRHRGGLATGAVRR
jgi:dipeptide/tripeptide permease